MKRKKSKIGTVMMITGTMLITAALSLALYNIYTDKNAEKMSANILRKLDSQIITEQLTDETPLSELYSEYSDSADMPASSDSETETPHITVDTNNYIGIIEIPSIAVRLPVMQDWSYDNLKISPCRYSGSAEENNLIIAAHNYSSHFGNIKNLNTDDKVYFTDANGSVYSYAVNQIESIPGNDGERMLSGDWALSIFTCNFDGSERITVRCIEN